MTPGLLVLLSLSAPAAAAPPLDLSQEAPNLTLSVVDMAGDVLVIHSTGASVATLFAEDGRTVCAVSKDGSSFEIPRTSDVCAPLFSLSVGDEITFTLSTRDRKEIALTVRSEGTLHTTRWCDGEWPVEPDAGQRLACGDGSRVGFSLGIDDASAPAALGLPWSAVDPATELFWWDEGSGGWRSFAAMAAAGSGLAPVVAWQAAPNGAMSPFVTVADPLAGRVAAETGRAAVRVRGKDGAETQWNVQKVTPTSAANAGPSCAEWAANVPSNETVTGPPLLDSPSDHKRDRMRVPYVLCVDMRDAPQTTWRLFSHYEGGDLRVKDDLAGERRAGVARVEVFDPYLLPDRPMLVSVATPAGARAALKSSGDIQSPDEGSIDAGFEGQSGGSAAGEGLEEEFLLAPRKPGAMTVTVTLSTSKVVENAPVWGDAYSRDFEFVVLRKRVGALRTGLGVAWTPSAREYAMVAMPDGSGDRVTVARGKGKVVDPELVIGFAPFLGAGRVYTADRQALGRRRVGGGVESWLAPYLGLGLVSGSSTGVDFLQTWYLGADLEIGRGFSIDLAMTARSADRLLAPYTVGAVAPEGSDPLGKRLRPGLGLIVCVTPWFFRQVPGLGWTGVGTTD